jgi:hypothetical protein
MHLRRSLDPKERSSIRLRSSARAIVHLPGDAIFLTCIANFTRMRETTRDGYFTRTFATTSSLRRVQFILFSERDALLMLHGASPEPRSAHGCILVDGAFGRRLQLGL